MRVKLRRTLRDAGHLDRGRLRIKPRSAKIPALRTSKRHSCCGRDDTKKKPSEGRPLQTRRGG